MARPRSEVRLSFDEDTVRLRRNNWSDSFWVEWRWPCSGEIAEIIEAETSYWCNPRQIDSVVVDWRGSCRAIEEGRIVLSQQMDEAYLRELRGVFGLSETELEEWQTREREHYQQNAYWAPTYMGPTRTWYDEEADKRAQGLLVECLSPAQKEEFNYRRSFTVVSKSKRTYRIEFVRNYNVRLLNAHHQSIAAYCAGPLEDVPIADMMLSQKLMLENDEERFLRIANKQGESFEEFVRGAREGGILDDFRRLLQGSTS